MIPIPSGKRMALPEAVAFGAALSGAVIDQAGGQGGGSPTTGW
jgi:hypothetical protein